MSFNLDQFLGDVRTTVQSLTSLGYTREAVLEHAVSIAEFAVYQRQRDEERAAAQAYYRRASSASSYAIADGVIDDPVDDAALEAGVAASLEGPASAEDDLDDSSLDAILGEAQAYA